jgi:hypothetical protein
MIERFDDQLLDEFVHNFYGYGNYGGGFWFVGMEEEGGNSFTEVDKRLSTWARRGKRELEDVAAYHAEIGITRYFAGKPKLQRTWSNLIRIFLCHVGQGPTPEQVLEYQRTSLGRLNGDTCLVELLPLPSPSTGHWLYAQHSHLSYLADRREYQQSCLALRIAHLRQRINEQKPKAVVFYGLSYRKHWQAIAGVDFQLQPNGISVGRNGSSLFVMTKHPVARGVTNEYFHQVGRLIFAELMKR